MGQMNTMKATKEQFNAYREVQNSGMTNMMDVATVVELCKSMHNTKISREQVLDIIYNYDDYQKAYAKETA